ncbi:MAG: YggT family protein [Lactobacillus sp.]
MATFLLGLWQVISWVIYIYSLVIVIYCIMTWVPALINSRVGQFLARLVEPYLRLFHLPAFWGIDFSPVLGLLVIYLLENYVLRWLFNILLHLVNR